MKKQIIILMVFILLVTNIYAFSFSEVLGWAVSVKEENWEVKALCAVAKGVACEGSQFLINPQGYIQSKSLDALSEASPELGKAVSLATNPQGFITQEALKEIAKDNPKEAGNLGQVLTTVEQLKTLGVTKGDFKFDKNGYVNEANFISEKEGKIGNLVGKEVKQDSLQISKGIKFDKKESISTLTLLDDKSYVKVNDNLYMNIKKQDENTNSYLKLNDKGELIEADITSNKNGGSYTLGNEIVKAPPDTRVTYKDGQVKVYGNGKSFDLSNSLESKIQPTNIKILDGDSITIIDNKVIGKSFEGEGFNVLGLDNGFGEVTFSNGNIVNIGKNTNALVKGIEHTVFSDSLNLYYDTNFDPSDHTNENYFNYGKNKIQLGGSGFISSLGDGNEVFPELKLKKSIQGTPVPKYGDFELYMKGGTLEIEKDMERGDLFFNVKSKGNFEVKDGRTTFISEDNQLYTKQNKDFGISYGMNLNNEYISDGFLLKDKDENMIVNNYLPWENTIRKTNEIDTESPFVSNIKQKLQKEWGVNPKVYFGWMDDEREEDLIKWIYQASEIASQNKYNTKVSPSEVFTTFMAEGGAAPKGIIENKYGYYYNHNTFVFGFSDLGLDYIGQEMPTLKKAGFVSNDVQLSELTNAKNEQGVSVPSGNFNNLQDDLMVQAGDLAYRKYMFVKDFKNYFGEDEFNKLTDDEAYFWTSFYYNCGPGCGKGELTGTQYISGAGKKVRGQGRNKIYKTLEYPEPLSNLNPRVNSLIRVSTKQWIDSLGLFDFP